MITYYQCYQDTTYTTLSQTHIPNPPVKQIWVTYGYRLLSSPSTNIWVLCKCNIKTMQSCLDISKLTFRACMKYIERPTLYYCLKSDWIFVLESCWYMSTNSSSCLNPQVALHITIISPISQTKFINVEKWKTLHCSLPEWHFECRNTANNANIAWWTL